MYKKIISVLSIVVMMLSMFSFANAATAENEIMPNAQYLGEHSAFSTLSSGKLTGNATFLGVSSVTKITISITFQKKNLLWWNDIETWTGTKASASYNFVKSISVGSGTYRIKAVYKVYCGSDYETITAYSDPVS